MRAIVVSIETDAANPAELFEPVETTAQRFWRDGAAEDRREPGGHLGQVVVEIQWKGVATFIVQPDAEPVQRDVCNLALGAGVRVPQYFVGTGGEIHHKVKLDVQNFCSTSIIPHMSTRKSLER